MDRPVINHLRYVVEHGPVALVPSWGPSWDAMRWLLNRGYVEAKETRYLGGGLWALRYAATEAGTRALVATCFKARAAE